MRHTARVIHGRGEGKRIGIPTLNFFAPKEMAEPYGIYAGWVWIGEDRHPAVFHWGPIPSYGITDPSLEAHLLNADLKTPPAEATLELLAFMREIMNIPDTSSLVRQIEEDIRKAAEMLERI